MIRIIVIKSTVPVGTNDFIKKYDRRPIVGISVTMVSNPEFLRQGSAIEDTMKADRIIIGSENEEAASKIQEMYRPLNVASYCNKYKKCRNDKICFECISSNEN